MATLNPLNHIHHDPGNQLDTTLRPRDARHMLMLGLFNVNHMLRMEPHPKARTPIVLQLLFMLEVPPTKPLKHNWLHSKLDKALPPRNLEVLRPVDLKRAALPQGASKMEHLFSDRTPLNACCAHVTKFLLVA